VGPLGRELAIWEIHLKSTDKSPHTIKSYRQAVRTLGAWLADRGLPLDPEDITTDHLRSFQAYLLAPKDEGGAGARTSAVCTRHDALKLFFRFFEDEDDLPNPMRRVHRPDEREATIQPLTEEQLAALLDTCRGRDFQDRRDLAIIRTWISTPARLSEIAMLRIVGHDGEPDVDPLAGLIHVMGKGRRPRQMALSPKACKALIRYEKVREHHPNAHSPAYWLSHKHERFTQSGIQQMIARRARQASIGHVHPHMFRHTYATTFLDNGGTESALMRQGGWRSRKIMERYTKLLADARADREARQINVGDHVLHPRPIPSTDESCRVIDKLECHE
jgi:site-specific recombinase XerD